MKKFYIVEALIIVAFIVGLFVGKSLNSEEEYYKDYYKLAAKAWEEAREADTPPVGSEEPKRLRKVWGLYRKVFEKYRDSSWADDALFEMASRMDPTSEEAFALCRRLINNYPDSDWADDSLYIISMGYYHLGDHYSSKEDSENALKKAEQYYDRALMHFNDLIERYPGSNLIDEALLNSAMCYYGKGNLDKALAEFAEFEQDYPASELAYDVRFHTGMIKFDKQKYTEALTEFQTVVDSGDKELAPQAQFNMGQVYFAQEKYNNAEKAYQKIISNFPESKSAKDAYFYLGWVYQRQEKYEKAIDQLKEAINKFPNNENAPNSQVFVAQILVTMDKIDKAIETYKMVASNKDYDYDMRRAAQYYVGKLYESEKDDLKQAVVEYEELLEKFPKLHINPQHPSNDISGTYVEDLKHRIKR